MTLAAVAALILILAAGGFGVAGAVTSFGIVDAVNGKLADGNRVEPIGWYPAKTLGVIRKYQELYPEGTMVRRLGAFTAFGLASVIAAAGTIGFPLFLVAFLAASAAVLVWYTFFRKARV